MIHASPGSLVHYQAPGIPSTPPWPAVVCTDDMASESAMRSRPRGYVTLVLLMSDNLEFRWARTTEMSDYDPNVFFEHKETVGRTPGLGNAYQLADSALDAGLDLSHWQQQVKESINNVLGSASNVTSSDEDTCSDPEMQLALRLSREEFYSKRSKERNASGSAKLPTPSLSPPTPVKLPGRKRALASSLKPPGQREDLHDTSSPRDLPHDRALDVSLDPANESSSSRSAGKRPVQSTPFQNPSIFDVALGGLDRSRKDPISDIVEGEISESKDFVQVLVGPDAEVSTLQKDIVWNREYFRDPKQGLNHFNHNSDGIWELQHPALSEIEPEDFVFVAEYLESEEFGHRHPQLGEETEESFAQCVSAWVTAEKLGMSDMMDHIVEKLKRLAEPELQSVLVFACQVYGSQDTMLLPHTKLKDYLATYIAENWWIYLHDDHLHSGFIDRLQKLPELERDIYQRRIPPLNERIERIQEDDDSEMGEV